MRKWLGGCIGALAVVSAAPALADGVADAKALIEKYSKLPTFEPPGPAFDAKACMKGKKMFAIPLTDDNPFEVAIIKRHGAGRQHGGLRVHAPGRPSSRPINGRRASTRRPRRSYNLIDLVGGLPPEFIAPQIAEVRKQRRQGHHHARLRLHARKRPTFLDGSAKTDYVTVGKLIAAWTIAKTDGKVDAVVHRAGRNHPDDAAARTRSSTTSRTTARPARRPTSTRRRRNGRPRSSRRCRPRCWPTPPSTTCCRSTTRCRSSPRPRSSRRVRKPRSSPTTARRSCST